MALLILVKEVGLCSEDREMSLKGYKQRNVHDQNMFLKSL